MNRRKFLGITAGAVGGSMLVPGVLYGKRAMNRTEANDIILGHGSFRYRLDYDWGKLKNTPVNDCHEMVQDRKGRIVLLTNETRNNIIIYDKSGKLLETWGSEYPGAHGLTLWREDDEDFLLICDYERHEVIKTTIDGRVVMILPYPADSGKYISAEQFKPTESAVAPNGDIYITDGYGEQFITRYNHKGELLQIFGGRGKEVHNFDNAHGIAIDDRDPENITLLVTARAQHRLKRFTLDGKFLETIELPGAMINRPVIDGENIYLSVLLSNRPSESGFVMILDGQNRLVSNLGGSDPVYDKNGDLKRLHQVVKVFKHPHDVCVDDDKNLYICQWNSGKIYPIKLIRV